MAVPTAAPTTAAPTRCHRRPLRSRRQSQRRHVHARMSCMCWAMLSGCWLSAGRNAAASRARRGELSPSPSILSFLYSGAAAAHFFIAEATAAYLVHKTHPVHKNGPQAQGVEPSSKRAKRASSEAEEGGEGAESGVDLVFCPRCTFLNDPANARCSLCATSFRLCGGGGGGSGGGSGGGGGGARGAEAQASYPGIDS